MTLGASALGQFALGGDGFEAAVNYVDCAAQITITSSIACAIAITSAGEIEISAQIAALSSVTCAISITGAEYGDVSISASIAMISALTSAITALQPVPNPGVSFTLSDRAGGA